MKKKERPLELEKKVNDELWQQVLDDIAIGNIDAYRIANVMHRLNMLDYVLIEEDRRDLL